MTANLTGHLIEECKARLLRTKQELINRSSRIMAEYQNRDRAGGGDEADQSAAVLEEYQFLTTQERLRYQIMEIDAALGRIERGNYGICEETEEPIEKDRLLAIPWTRLSIEGAEMRESNKKKFAK